MSDHRIFAPAAAGPHPAVGRPAQPYPEKHPLTPDDPDVLDMLDTLKLPQVVGRKFSAMPDRNGKPGKPSVLLIPSPNFNDRRTKVDTLIIHHTSSAASAKAIGSFFSQKSAGVSAHYTVDKDGTIVQSVPDNEAAWHAGVSKFDGRTGVNDFSLGIEICNVGDGQEAFTDAQYKALGQLVAYLMATHHIGWDHITGHKDIALPKGRKDDPAINFDYDKLKAAVAEVQARAKPSK